MNARVLVFNHSETLLTLFQACLQRSGYEVHSFLQSDLSLPLIQREQPDAVIVSYFGDRLTLLLPFIQALRADPETERIPVLLCSSGRLAHDVAAAIDIPGLAFFPYPFSSTHLPVAMADLLPLSRDEAQLAAETEQES